eukprot:gnl/MRDRNA2_/MRDRNA2_109516_c0_seq1.p1 gnl/MRDRNA2_/MRDRNA2_109516_c0~~gnl/MRDRNA2_/MRDRNA2_109516_c0_seq1.p1  ORF type:complete len:244 (-),score=39.77 gnl/MRDRNA2_/MRDRNA2_109516_c0_seq1:135-866(-)
MIRHAAPASMRSPQNQYAVPASPHGQTYTPSSPSYCPSPQQSRTPTTSSATRQDRLGETMSEKYGTGLEDEPSIDLKALLDLLTKLDRDRVIFKEVTYIINRWGLGPILLMKHHGFVLKCEGCVGFLGLDFGRKGIMWDTYDEFPEMPDNVCFAKKYQIDADPLRLKSYCEATKPFDWLRNDCSVWATGLLRVLKVNVNKDSGYSRADSVDLLNGEHAIESVEGAHCGLPLGTEGEGPSCWSR